MASIVTQPADVIKTHMQLKPEVHANIRSTIAGILKSHGAKGLFTGLVPRVTRRTLMAAFTWTFYEQVGSWDYNSCYFKNFFLLVAGDSDSAVHELS